MVEQLRHNHGVRGCVNLKSLMHFLDPNLRLHLRKEKMLADRRHGEGKRDGTQGLLERKNDEPFEVRHKRIERESLVKKINDLHLENTFSHPDKTDADILRIKPMLGVDNNSQKDKHCAIEKGETCSYSHAVVPTCALLNVKDKPPISSRFKFIKQRIKDIIKDNRKDHYISMDAVLHKIP